MAKKTRKANRNVTAKKNRMGIYFLIFSLIILVLIAVFVNTSKISTEPKAWFKPKKTIITKATNIKYKYGSPQNECQSNYPLSDQTIKPDYDYTTDYCASNLPSNPNLLACDTTKFVIDREIFCNKISQCCRAVLTNSNTSGNSNYNTISDGYCKRISTASDAVCAKSKPGSKYYDLKIKCKIYSNTQVGAYLTGLDSGTCYATTINPTITPTNTPTPTPTPVRKFNNDCGVNRIDCTSTFSDQTTHNNAYEAVCATENGKVDYKCYFKVPNDNKECKKGQYAYPAIYRTDSSTYRASSCVIGIKGKTGAFDSSDPSYDLCATKVISVSDSGLGAAVNCKNKSEE